MIRHRPGWRRLTELFRWFASIAAISLGAMAGENQASVADTRRDYVVLLHGLGRTAWSMKRLQWVLEDEGYRVVNVSYPSTRLSVQSAASWLDDLLSQWTRNPDVSIHFVTHSLGGIILRQYLADHPLENLGRVVMLAPPNQGSELADRLKDNPLFKLVNGPAGQQLGTGASGLPTRLGPASFQLGVIAGDRSLNPLFSAWIPGPDDGKVSIQSTKLEGMRDFVVVHRTHTWMAWRRDVISAVLRFLQAATFHADSENS